jgi:hypothetical protein
MRVIHFFRRHWAVILPALLFVLLLARNPFSERTLIPNLEPFPDSFHYISPALTFLRGEGLYISREGRHFLPNVPPLYSFALMSVYVFTSSVPSFYFVNVALGFISLFLFYLILEKIFPQKIGLHFLLCFLYVTNYILYWFPQLAMAENLIVPLCLATIYALLLKPSKKIAVSVAFLSASFYATKYASLSLSVITPVLFSWRIFRVKNSSQQKKIGIWFVLSLIVAGGIYLLYEQLFRGSNSVAGLLSLLFSVFAPKKIVQATTQGTGEGGFFSMQYAGRNIREYTHWLIGEPLMLLYKPLTLMPKYLALPAVAGLVVSLFSKRRWVSVVLGGMLFSTIFLMMTFYAADGRYLIIAIPIMLLSLGLFMSWLAEHFLPYGAIFYRGLLLFFLVLYVVTQAQRLKFDIMLNLKYAENPWYYISVKTFDSYLAAHRTEFSKEPVVISALAPYLIDFYAKEPMLVLPMSSGQEFQSRKQEIWGDHNYDDLASEYQKYFEEGRPVFLTKYGLGREDNLHADFNALFQKFTFKKVAEGCYTLCDVYQMTGVIKEESKKAK